LTQELVSLLGKLLLLNSLCLLVGFGAGCRKDVSFHDESLTEVQREFFAIRSLHEAEKERQVIERGERFLQWVQDAELRRPVQYFVAVNAERLGLTEEARKYYRRLVNEGRESRWADLARESLASLEGQKRVGGEH
jgi:hypothetical protein